jgi:tetratricopeptide (TPR) repeat protein
MEVRQHVQERVETLSRTARAVLTVAASLAGLLLPLRAGLSQDCAGSGEEKLTCWFHQGLDLQSQAGEGIESPKSALLQSAALAYEQALALDPNRGATLNNLAQVYAGLGRDADAERLFVRAVALKDPLRPFYHRNFGDFLVHRGDWQRAAKSYRATLEENPGDRQAHTSLVEILSQHSPQAVPETISFLIRKGQVLPAEEEALNRLEMGNATQGVEYLTILVSSLAEQSYLPEEFASSRAAQVLKSISDQAEIGEGAREVLRVNEGQDLRPGSYSWWAKPPIPRREFRHLLRSLAESQSKAAHYDLARSYLRLSVDLTQAEPDLAASWMLVNLPTAGEDVAAIDAMVERNERLLPRSPATQAEVRLYRHDLGLYYGFLKHWQGAGPSSGIYQLSKAIHAGGVDPLSGPPNTPVFDARLYTRLSAGYTETGKPDRARRTLFELAEAFRSHGMDREADALLAMLGGGHNRHRPPDRRRETFDDPALSLRDFTTERPGPP